MLHVFFDVVLPVALVALVGGAVSRWRKIPVAPISALVFYLFSPSLVFYSMATTHLSAGTSLRIVGVMVVTYIVMYICSTLWSILRHHDPALRAAFAVGATTPNVGNMGLPVAQLAFGEAGLQVAVMNFVAGSMLANSAGLAIASTAGATLAAAWKVPLRYPSLYAAIAGVLVNVLGIDLPTVIESPAKSLAGASVPTMLVVLGMQLQNAGGKEHLVDLGVVNLGRLLIAPLVALGVATALGLSGVTRDTLFVLAAMPTAVIAIILATEFNAAPPFVTRVVVSSTALSILSLTVLISLAK